MTQKSTPEELLIRLNEIVMENGYGQISEITLNKIPSVNISSMTIKLPASIHQIP